MTRFLLSVVLGVSTALGLLLPLPPGEAAGVARGVPGCAILLLTLCGITGYAANKRLQRRSLPSSCTSIHAKTSESLMRACFYVRHPLFSMRVLSCLGAYWPLRLSVRERAGMPAPRHLQNAPIAEAIIDFRVKARPEFRPEEFTNLQTQLSGRFPKVDEYRGLQATFGMIQGRGRPPVVQDLGFQGYFWKTSDEKTIVQFRVDGFTFNRLRPYTSWTELFPQALDLWHLYSRVSRPEVITRLAVRYINRIPLPAGVITFETYLRAAPAIPSELPQYISSFLTRVTIHDPQTDIVANVAQALEPNTQEQRLMVILDIDAYKQSEFAIDDDPMIEQTLQQLRTFKNLIFFNSLTEETLRQFE